MKKSNVLGKINSSQDGVIIYEWSVAPCLTSGHGNCPKVVLIYDTEDSTGDKEGLH